MGPPSEAAPVVLGSRLIRTALLAKVWEQTGDKATLAGTVESLYPQCVRTPKDFFSAFSRGNVCKAWCRVLSGLGVECHSHKCGQGKVVTRTKNKNQ